ncbi:MAG: hypothetical protein JXA77_17485 [Bacteroidales bacterium]|nr:hypothetical protein [Bacteroidales bacterium]MBN2821465.1 hypothetical protein [Bacteroidales bacterium]
MQKISTIVLYILAAISVVLALMFFLGPTEIAENGEAASVFTGLNLAWAGVLFIIAVIITLAFSLIQLISHPKALKGALVAIIATVVLVAISYFLSSGEIPEGEEVTATTARIVDTGLIMTAILAVVSLLAIVVSEVYRAFK